MSHAKARVTYLLPTQGCNEWDRSGAELYDAEGMAAYCDALALHCPE
ncbi:MAG: UPF0261 family protein, partial [Rhodobacterales bacterium]